MGKVLPRWSVKSLLLTRAKQSRVLCVCVCVAEKNRWLSENYYWYFRKLWVFGCPNNNLIFLCAFFLSPFKVSSCKDGKSVIWLIKICGRKVMSVHFFHCTTLRKSTFICKAIKLKWSMWRIDLTRILYAC